MQILSALKHQSLQTIGGAVIKNRHFTKCLSEGASLIICEGDPPPSLRTAYCFKLSLLTVYALNFVTLYVKIVVFFDKKSTI